ncbi:TPA: hypothetical protein U1Z40_002417 [Streptococcus suis]|nr:hypothetical protein [Streptococcus suis]HEL2299847.1 hypothetical protein [Streptococcus suis]HEM4569095.1 hypothetical protein [Streptococcus suis]
MTQNIKLPDWRKPKYGGIRYGSFEELQERLLYKRIVKWDRDHLELEDGTVVTIELSESDCCAYAGGEFEEVELDAVITDVKIGKQVETEDDWGVKSRNVATIYHNQNPIALANCSAGHNGYYYSVGSLVIDKIHFPVVRA